MTTMSEGKILKNRAASPTNSPDAFIKVCGFSSSTRSPPIDALREFALEAVAKPRDAVPSGDRLDRHEADIVAVAGVAGTRIAETDNEAHQRADRGRSTGAGQRTQLAAGCSAAGAAVAAAAASSRTAEDAAMLAIVKSRSVIVGRQPSGMMTPLIWMLSPISSPLSSTTS